MAAVLNRHTLEYLASVNTPDYEPEDWLVNPIVPDCARVYWKVTGDTVVEMSAGEKAVVDLALAKQAKAAEINNWYATQLANGYPTGNGYNLAASIADQTRFTQDAVLQTNLLNLEMATGTDVIGFLDATDAPQGMTITAYITLLVQYGQWCRAKLLQQATFLGQLAAATTLEQVDAIDPNA